MGWYLEDQFPLEGTGSLSGALIVPLFEVVLRGNQPPCAR